MYKIGAQLYTVRAMMGSEEEMKAALSKIKEIGYDSVQLYDLGTTKKMEACCAYCRQIGLEIAGILTDLDFCEKNREELFALCKTYGIPDVGVSSSITEYGAASAYIPRANAFAKEARAQGFHFSYHNHGHEFIKTSCGKSVMELFLEGFDKATVDFMPDTYWVHDGGFDVRRFIELTHGRVQLLHMKDLVRKKDGHTFAPVGSGNLYMEGILETAREHGIAHFIVEQDQCEKDPMDCLKESYLYLKTRLGGK